MSPLYQHPSSPRLKDTFFLYLFCSEKILVKQDFVTKKKQKSQNLFPKNSWCPSWEKLCQIPAPLPWISKKILAHFCKNL